MEDLEHHFARQIKAAEGTVEYWREYAALGDAEIVRMKADATVARQQIAAIIKATVCKSEVRYTTPGRCVIIISDLKAEIARLKATIEPVRSWYDGDGEVTDVAEMLALAVADLQDDRAAVLKLGARVAELEEANERARNQLREVADYLKSIPLAPEMIAAIQHIKRERDFAYQEGEQSKEQTC